MVLRTRICNSLWRRAIRATCAGLTIFLASDLIAAGPAISAGGGHGLALKRDGGVLAWGDNMDGKLGDGTTEWKTVPTPVRGLPTFFGLNDVQSVVGGDQNSSVVTRDGRVWSWGSGALGDGITIFEYRAYPVAAQIENVSAVAVGTSFTLALKRDGTVWGWGSNINGELGVDPTYRLGEGLPVRVEGLDGVIAIAAGDAHALALRSDGTVWSWGSNFLGQLGQGNVTSHLATPSRIASLSNVVAIAARQRASLVVTADGAVWQFGNDGRLGGIPPAIPTPIRVIGLEQITAISAGYGHYIALRRDGTVWAWGLNRFGQLGNGEFNGGGPFGPTRVSGLSGISEISAGNFYSLAMRADGTVMSWGDNDVGQLGDGTFVSRPWPVSVVQQGGGGTLASGDWYLDLDPAVSATVASTPNFLVNVAGTRPSEPILTNTAVLKFREADVGSTQNLYVFALAPKGAISSAHAAKADGNSACILSQLSPSGTLIPIGSSSDLSPSASAVLGSQGSALTILNGVSSSGLAGVTLYVGYGPGGSAMLERGQNRSVISIPGSLQCKLTPPQTGWWWNPAEDGRGYSIEVNGGNLFFAAFLYDPSGRSTWLVSTGPVSLDGAYYRGELLAARGGQSLGGPYPGAPALESLGIVSMLFESSGRGALTWPGGTIPIERFNIVPGGLAMGPSVGMPESGWWWNPEEGGRGFFLEWQGDTLDIAGYLYDDAGNPTWFLTVGKTQSQAFSGNWWSYVNGQTLTGAWRPHARASDNVAPLSISFQGPDRAVMTLPNGRSTQLRRHRF